jgi:hypothetical protein
MRRTMELEGLGGKINIRAVLAIFLVSPRNDKRQFMVTLMQSMIAHSYQYTFEPNPTWSAFYAPAAEICKYLHRVAEKYDVMRYVQLSHKVLNCTWDDSAKKWYEKYI